MKKEMRLLGIVFFVAILLILISQFVLAQTVADKIFDPVKSMFADWEQGNLSVNIAKYLFFAMLIILIFSIIDFIPTIKEMAMTLKVILAVIISFLATAYLTPSEIYAMIASYSAMGFVMGAGLPFVILIFFTIEITKKGGAGARLFAKLMWFAFIAFLGYKLIAGWADPTDQLTWGMALAYLIAIVVALLYILVFQKQLMKMWFKEEIETSQERLKNKLEEQKRKRDLEAKSFEEEAKPNKT